MFKDSKTNQIVDEFGNETSDIMEQDKIRNAGLSAFSKKSQKDQEAELLAYEKKYGISDGVDIRYPQTNNGLQPGRHFFSVSNPNREIPVPNISEGEQLCREGILFERV